MSDILLQEQINDINRKLDLLIDEITIQRQNRETVSDLVDDIAVIGKDLFRTTVTQLDDAGIELDGESLRSMVFKLIRNAGNMTMLLDTLESLTDLTRDLTPIVKQVGLDGIKKFHELEQKGYFDLLNQLGLTFDNILSRYTREELLTLSENLIPVTDTLMLLADPAVLGKINTAASALRDIKADEIEEYSVWRLMRELNKPEIKKSIGFLMKFLKVVNGKN